MLRKKLLALGAGVLSLAGSVASAQERVIVVDSAPAVRFDDDRRGLSGVQAGATLYFLRPYINNNTAFVTTGGIGTPNASVTSTEFDWDYNVSPAFWLGWTGDSGLGVRARYFDFDESSNTLSRNLTAGDAATTTINPAAGLSPVVGVPPTGFTSPGDLLQGGAGQDFLTFDSDLRIQTIDLEVTYAHEVGNFDMLFSGGGRYLQMSQDYRATLTNAGAAGASQINALVAGHNFYGGGPTIAWLGRVHVGCSGLALFGTVRGSLLVGEGRQDAFFSERVIDPLAGNQDNLPNNRSTFTQTLPIGEIELGLEYGRSFSGTRGFIRAAAVNQTYFDAGSASSRDGNLTLFGGQVSIGLNY